MNLRTMALGAVLLAAAAFAQDPAAPERAFVVVCPIEGMIDEGIKVVVERAVREAAGAQALIFRIDTPGGLVDAAVDIANAIMDAKCPTIAYPVGMGAISAGALISLSCQHIVMAPEANIGAATPVTMSPEGMQPTGEKEMSYVRAKFRSLADANGYNAALAEAMVDPDVILRGYTDESGHYVVYRAQPDDTRNDLLLPAGKLLTMTAAEAEKYGLIDAVAPGVAEVASLYGYADAEVRTIEMTWAEAFFRWLTSPTIAGVLLLLGVAGLYFELQSPGFGIAGIVGLTCLALFFGAHIILGLADWLDVALVIAGVTLILIEIFVLPGFGVTGVAGTVLLIAGIYLSLTRVTIPRYSWDYERLAEAAYSMLVAMVGLACFMVLIWKLFPRTPLYGKLVLSAAQGVDAGYVVQTGAEAASAVGLEGVALTMLRPAGRARIEGKTYDVVSRADFIEKGAPVVIVQVDGNRYVVDRSKENT